ncbi:mucin-2 [Streptomyces sp. A 4/2]|uniref:mucin-2 n=1 Tax=Streptomyces sp. A 4/2 TaxID=2934314 RepID=UPI00202589BE|nr:mucin-2 [Streptomyces sp. A 4/2]
MRPYATAQNIGTRDTQCDATAIHTAPSGARAYVLLDGIGSSQAIREWTVTAARRLARAASRRGDAEAGLRHIYEGYAADPDREDPYELRYLPSAAAVVAVVVPGQPLQVAWAGDSRAYLLVRGVARRLTEDHNLRRVYPPTATYPHGGNRNRITSYLGGVDDDEQLTREYGHPAIESVTVPLDGPCRLLLASDGAYEPHDDARHDLYAELDDDPLAGVATAFVNLAVETSLRTTAAAGSGVVHSSPHADNATVLLADLA